MRSTKPAITPRSIVDEVFGRGMTREIWTGNYNKVLPVSVQDFELSAVLPAVFYMFRFAQRRGKGRFVGVYGGTKGTPRQRRRTATMERIANKLGATPTFEGFDDDAGQAILGDLLLCFTLENVKHALGRREQVQRVAPAHYMASWVDLPESIADLRYVPEMIVAVLADQKGDHVQQSREGERTWFAVGAGCEENVLLKAFHQGVTRRGEMSSRASDHFDETTPVGLDQLLMIRLAQQLEAAPGKLRGSEGDKISNQRPIAEQTSKYFSEDIRNFVRAYSTVIPRHSFVDLLESCMAVGLTTIMTSAMEILLKWSETGVIQEKREQTPTPLFVDCSNGVDRKLKRLAEQSTDDFTRRIERVPVILMALRLLDHSARYNRKIKKLSIRTRPYATEWLNLLGDILYERHDEARPIFYNLEGKAAELAERLEQDYPEYAQILDDELGQPNPVWRLAEALTALQGRSNTYGHLITLFDSTLHIGRPNGLASKRRVTRAVAGQGTRRTREIRSLIFADSVLDYLVHRHVLHNGKRGNIGTRPLAFKDFLQILKRRYGFYVDSAPPGMDISNDLLRLNRVVLEQRLRDLGVFMGVNDAEAMKFLQPRYELAVEGDNEMV